MICISNVYTCKEMHPNTFQPYPASRKRHHIAGISQFHSIGLKMCLHLGILVQCSQYRRGQRSALKPPGHSRATTLSINTGNDNSSGFFWNWRPLKAEPENGLWRSIEETMLSGPCSRFQGHTRLLSESFLQLEVLSSFAGQVHPFPLNHLMVGFLRRSSAWTLAIKVIFSPREKHRQFTLWF